MQRWLITLKETFWLPPVPPPEPQKTLKSWDYQPPSAITTMLIGWHFNYIFIFLKSDWLSFFSLVHRALEPPLLTKVDFIAHKDNCSWDVVTHKQALYPHYILDSRDISTYGFRLRVVSFGFWVVVFNPEYQGFAR